MKVSQGWKKSTIWLGLSFCCMTFCGHLSTLKFRLFIPQVDASSIPKWYFMKDEVIEALYVERIICGQARELVKCYPVHNWACVCSVFNTGRLSA